METTNFDEISENYQNSKELPFRVYIEKFSLFRMLGNIKDKTILDLGCGTGIYAVEAVNRQAKKVIGIDASKEMIAIAKQNNEHNNLEYLHEKVEDLEQTDPFDLVMASYLLNFAKSKEQLIRFCETIYNNLKPNGKFVGINDNPGNSPQFFNLYKKYGFKKESSKDRKEGSPITYTFFNKDGTTFSLDNYYHSLETYEEAFNTVGFSSFQWKNLTLSEKSLEDYNSDYWRQFLNHPPIIGIEAIK